MKENFNNGTGDSVLYEHKSNETEFEVNDCLVADGDIEDVGSEGDLSTYIIYDDAESTRIDKFLAEQIEDLTRSYIQKLISEKEILVNDKSVKSNQKLVKGDRITLLNVEPKELNIVAQDIPLDIVYEDDQLIIVNKPVGMVVHPAPGNYTGTLVNAIMFHCKDRLSSINGVARPGIVHRIDKDTSGLLIVCKTDVAHSSIALQLKNHTVNRKYVGIVYNNVKNETGTINAPIGRGEKNRLRMAINYKNGKEAITHYEVIERLDHNRYTYMAFTLETGRTHQIRLHMAMDGSPLIGDPLYGPIKGAYAPRGQLLHAKEIGFIHPTTQEYMHFEVEPPESFMHILNNLRKKL